MAAHLGQAGVFLLMTAAYTFIAWRVCKSGRWGGRH